MNTQLQNKTKQRSNVMSHTTILRLLGITLALAMIAGTMLSQDFILNGNQTNNGTIKAKRDIINNTSSLVSISGTGTISVQGTGTSISHTIKSQTGSYAISFSNLDFIDTRTVTCAVDVTVTTRLRIGDGTTDYTGSSFTIGSTKLTLGGSSSFQSSSSTVPTLSGGTVEFSGTSSQAVLNHSSGLTYGTLTLSGAGAKSITSGGTVTAASLTQTGGQLSVTENVDVTGTGGFADLGAISATKRLRLTSASTSGSVTVMNNTGTGTFENAANISVTIATLSGNAGIIDQTGATGTLAFTNNITNTGTIRTATGTLDFNGTGTQTNTGGTITATGAGNVYFAGDIAANPGTLTLASTSTTTYDGAAQNLATGVTYGNLVAGGTGAKTGAANLAVAGNLTLTQNILQTSGALTMTSTTASNVSGAGEISGAVRRFHTFTTGSNYMFNRTDVYIGTATLAASDITLNMTLATDPSGTLPSTKYVKRNYAIIATNAGLLQSIRLAYAPGELQGSIADTKIGLRSYSGGTWSKVTNAGQTRSSGGGNNYMTYSGLSNTLATGEFGMFGIDFRSAAASANISLAAGYDENALPDNTDDVIIAHTGVVTGAVAVSVGTLTVNTGSDLTTNNSAGTLTVATSTAVNGTLNVTTANANLAAITVGSGGIVSVGSGRTLSGTSYTNNSSATSTFTGNVSLASLAHNGNGGAGTLNFNGSGSTISGAVTNATGTTISVGGTLSMMTSSALSLSSAGNITVNGASGILNVGQSGTASNLTMSGTSTLTLNNATSQLNVYGNLELGATSSVSNIGIITIGE
jgi:hypothetical protein